MNYDNKEYILPYLILLLFDVILVNIILNLIYEIFSILDYYLKYEKTIFHKIKKIKFFE